MTNLLHLIQIHALQTKFYYTRVPGFKEIFIQVKIVNLVIYIFTQLIGL